MTILLYLLIVSLAAALFGLWVFMWSLRSGQYDDLDGAANRILFDDAAAAVAPVRPNPPRPITAKGFTQVRIDSLKL